MHIYIHTYIYVCVCIHMYIINICLYIDDDNTIAYMFQDVYSYHSSVANRAIFSYIHVL